jgi:hypothetical protein
MACLFTRWLFSTGRYLQVGGHGAELPSRAPALVHILVLTLARSISSPCLGFLICLVGALLLFMSYEALLEQFPAQSRYHHYNGEVLRPHTVLFIWELLLK